MLIGGRWVVGSGAIAEARDPASDAVIGHYHDASPADVDAAVTAARRALEERAWRRMAPAERAKRLWRLAELIERDAEALAVLETLNQGMPLGLAQILAAAGPAEAIRYYAGWCTKIEGTTSTLSMSDPRPPGGLGPAHHAYTLREPIGVVGAITPWNVPMVMATAKLAPALAMGNTIVLKPAELTPLTALWLGDLLLEADFPPGVVNIVPGAGATCGAHLAAHRDVDKITFTGSTATGRRVAQLATGNLKKVALELGGKSPLLVFDDADLERTIPVAAESVFMNSGQICFAGSRLYAQRGVYAEVVAGIERIARGLKVGAGLEAGTELGPLISARQLDNALGHVRRGVAAGGRIVTGGGRRAGPGHFMEPTIVAVPDNACPVAREEVFGPVLTVMPFDGVEDAIRLANDTDYGLAAGVFTTDLSTAHGVAAEVRAGSVWINCYAMLDESLPNGGYRQSGWGREAGRAGVEEYTEIKSVVAGL
jgi:acyl-CoA reductase-like NAD-dependent aldehyde dehydrogenase